MSWISSTLVDTNDYLNTIIGQGTNYASILNDLANRLIGYNLYTRNIPNRDLTLIKNPYKRRYEGIADVNTHNKIGDKVNVYENTGRQIVFLDDFDGLGNYIFNYDRISSSNSKVIANMDNLINNRIKYGNRHYDIKNVINNPTFST
jgi:hypothetical protein